MASASRCAQVEHALVERGGEGLSRWERRRLVRHLRGCPACRAVLDRMLVVEDDAAAFDPGTDERRYTPEGVCQDARETRPQLVATGAHPWLGRALGAAVALGALLLITHGKDPYVLHADAVIASVREPEASNLQRSRLVVAPVAFGQPAIVTVDVDDGRARPPEIASPAAARALRLLGIDLSRPLALEPFRAWRASLAAPRDEVIRLADGAVRLRTWAVAPAPVRYGEVVVAGERPRVTHMAFVVDDLRLDMQETAYRTMPPTEAVSVQGLQPERLERAEMALRAALLESGADLSRDLRVTRSPSGVSLSGTMTPAQRAAFSRRLPALPDVQAFVRTRQVDGAPAPALAGWRARVLTDVSKRGGFAGEVHGRVQQIGAHLAALVQLDERYPASAVRRLPPDVRAQFDAIVTGHYRALRTEVRDARPAIAVLAGPEFSSATSGIGQGPPADWRARVSRAAGPVRDMTRLVDLLLRRDDLSDDTRDDEREPLRAAYAAAFAALQ